MEGLTRQIETGGRGGRMVIGTINQEGVGSKRSRIKKEQDQEGVGSRRSRIEKEQDREGVGSRRSRIEKEQVCSFVATQLGLL